MRRQIWQFLEERRSKVPQRATLKIRQTPGLDRKQNNKGVPSETVQQNHAEASQTKNGTSNDRPFHALPISSCSKMAQICRRWRRSSSPSQSPSDTRGVR